jgi:hypothetical protein
LECLEAGKNLPDLLYSVFALFAAGSVALTIQIVRESLRFEKTDTVFKQSDMLCTAFNHPLAFGRVYRSHFRD